MGDFFPRGFRRLRPCCLALPSAPYQLHAILLLSFPYLHLWGASFFGGIWDRTQIVVFLHWSKSVVVALQAPWNYQYQTDGDLGLHLWTQSGKVIISSHFQQVFCQSQWPAFSDCKSQNSWERRQRPNDEAWYQRSILLSVVTSRIWLYWQIGSSSNNWGRTSYTAATLIFGSYNVVQFSTYHLFIILRCGQQYVPCEKKKKRLIQIESIQ